MRLTRLLAPLTLLAGSSLLALGAAELVVRALWKDETTMYPRYHTDYRYGPYTLRGIRPNARFRHTSVDGSWEFVTNSRGLRDRREFSYAKPAGTLRVLALGDSHTQGYEVRQEATYSAVLERYLAAHGVPAEVLNAGVSGFGTAEELAFLENEGYRYQPDVVVLGFYANDFEDNVKAGLFGLENGKLIERQHEHLPGVRIQNVIYRIPGVQWLSENSYFYSLLFNRVWQYFKSALAERAAKEAAQADAAPDGGDLEYAVATKTEHSPFELQLTIALIERMQRYCESRGLRLILVDIPQPGDGPYRAKESLPESTMKSLGGAHLEVVTSGELLADAGGAAELHLPHGQHHISEFTHALIGLELGRRILRR